MPDNVVGQSIYAVACSLGHLGKAFCLGLVFEGVAREVYAGAVDVCFNDDVYAADAVEGYFFVFVGAPVAHCGHVLAVRGVLLVTCGCVS